MEGSLEGDWKKTQLITLFSSCVKTPCGKLFHFYSFKGYKHLI